MSRSELRERYRLIFVWGELVGLPPEVVDAQLCRADEECAPRDAVLRLFIRSTDGQMYLTYDEVKCTRLRGLIDAIYLRAFGEDLTVAYPYLKQQGD